MGAPKTQYQRDQNLTEEVIRRCNREYRMHMGRYVREGGKLAPADREMLKRDAFDSVAMLVRVGMQALVPLPSEKDWEGNPKKPNLSIATLAFGQAAKYTHVELTRPEQAAGIGNVMVVIKQYGEKLELENKVKVSRDEPYIEDAEVVPERVGVSVAPWIK